MNLEEIRAKKQEELFQRAQAEQQQQEQVQQQIAQVEAMVKPRLSKEALQRYGNVRMAHPEKAVQALIYLTQLVEKEPTKIIDDHELKKLLELINAQTTKKPTKIKFK